MNLDLSSETPGDLEAHMDLLRVACGGETQSGLATAPIFADSARHGSAGAAWPAERSPFKQYGLIAGVIDPSSRRAQVERLFYNVAAPSSTFICGSQGSGKSHTLSCLLENCLLPSAANVLPKPLSAVVFHYDTFISDTGGSPCEAAYLSSHPGVSVRVLCAPTNIVQIKRIYGNLPNVSVSALRIEQTDLNTRRMLDLMAVSSIKGEGMPLYLHVITRILRDMRVEQQASGSAFSYRKFKEMIQEQTTLNPGQLAPLQQRLETLESFMVKNQTLVGHSSKSKKAFKGEGSRSHTQRGTEWTPTAGRLTIVDLSCPCVTAETACSLFNICLSLFLEQDTSIGRVVGLDEAHKYMTDSAEASTLTESLLSTIRLQRHLGARIIISTQEPTISPKLLDLCSITIVHGFTSPDWLQALKRHLAGASASVRAQNGDSVVSGNRQQPNQPEQAAIQPLNLEGSDIAMALFSEIVDLRAGEALLFAPSAIMNVERILTDPESNHSDNNGGGNSDVRLGARISRLGQGVLKVRVRRRITEDGGESVLAA